MNAKINESLATLRLCIQGLGNWPQTLSALNERREQLEKQRDEFTRDGDAKDAVLRQLHVVILQISGKEDALIDKKRALVVATEAAEDLALQLGATKIERRNRMWTVHENLPVRTLLERARAIESALKELLAPEQQAGA